MIINEMINGFKKMPHIDFVDFGDGTKGFTRGEVYFYVHQICTENNGYGSPYLYHASDHNRDVRLDMANLYPSYKTLDLSKVKKVHFSKGCTVPRFKARDYFKDKKIAIKLSADVADVTFVGKNDIWKKINTEYCHLVDKNYLISVLQNGNGAGGVIPTATTEPIVDVLKTYPGNYVVCSGLASQQLNLYRAGYRSTYCCSTYLASMSVADYDFVQSWATDHKIYPEEELLKVINCTTMDLDSYESLSTMFKSSDTDNHVLAIELMSNCDYDTGFVYLSSLLMKYNQQIRSSKSNKHVNFQSLLKYLGYRDYTYIRLDDIYENLKGRSMDEEERSRQMDILLEVGKELMPLNCKYFKVTGLEIIK